MKERMGMLASARYVAAALCAIASACSEGAEDGPDGGLAVQGLSSGAPDTDCAGLVFNGAEYWFCDNERDWPTARSKCQAAGLELVRIDTQAENEFIQGQILSDRWIGASDLATEDTWEWMQGEQPFWVGDEDGSAVGTLYTNWDFGEPDGSSFDDCAQILGNGEWVEDNCSQSEEYICEGIADPCAVDSDGDGVGDCADQCPYDFAKIEPGDCGCADAPAPATAPCHGLCPANDTCDGQGTCGDPQACAPENDCTFVARAGVPYWFCRDDKPWNEARQKCMDVGMDLVHLESAEENAFVETHIKEASYIGATDAAEEGQWEWAFIQRQFWQGDEDGSAVNGEYSNWDPDHPKDYDSSLDCAEINTSGDWNVEKCTSHSEAYVCEGFDVCGGCPPSTDPCVTSFCDEYSGTCMTAPNEGAPCDDGDPATSDEICVLGACVADVPASTQEQRCAATAEQYASRLRADPGYAGARRQLAKHTASWRERCSGETIDQSCSPIFRIPVVVHVVGDTALQNAVTDQQIQLQIEQVNKDYRQMGGEVPAMFASVDADMEVEFALAERDPMCNSTTGITRTTTPEAAEWCIYPPRCPNIDTDAIKRSAPSPAQGGNPESSQHGIDPWNPEGYLNIWVGQLDGAQGYGTNPGTPAEIDGVMVDFRVFGPQDPAGTRYSLGRTLTHEIGHYFDLFHTYHPSPDGTPCTGSGPAGAANDGCDTHGDLVCDTPPQADFTNGNLGICPDPSNPSEFVKGCPIGAPTITEMSMNFMDETDDACMTMFTAGQKLRLGAALNGPRAGLKSSAGLIPPPAGNFDLWLADGRDDLGNQPNNETSKLWRSSDIWVRHRHDQEDNQEHQNPRFLAPGQTTSDGMDHNHVYVNVRNRGCGPTVPTYVNLFWAKASSSLSWPAPWDGSETVPGTSVPMGGPVDNAVGRNFVEVPVLQPGGTPGDWTVVKFDWFVPDPAGYASIGGDESHFCLLALIDPCRSSNFDSEHNLNQQGQNACADADGDGWPGEFTKEGPMPNPLIFDRLSANVRNQNNMAWKNVTVTGDADASGARTASAGTGGTPDAAEALYRFDEPEDFMGRDSIFDWGSVFVDLGSELHGRWVAAGTPGSQVRQGSGSEVEILASGAEIDAIPMEPEERFTIQARFVPDSASESLPLRAHPESYFLDMEQYAKRAGGDELVGGMQFVLKTYRPVAPPAQGPQ